MAAKEIKSYVNTSPENQVFIIFDHDGTARAFTDLEVADAAMEITDRLDDSNISAMYSSDGRVIAPVKKGRYMSLVVTESEDLEGLITRLAEYKIKFGLESDAQDVRSAAKELLMRERDNIWPRLRRRSKF